jgi:DNA-binding transcriptional LysR family regulator
MNFTQLKCFIVVAEDLSFTKASERLHFVQSAISNNISHLEEELGVELFVRNSRNVRLSPIGKIFLEDARKILEISEESRAKCDRWNQGSIGTLTIGYVFTPTLRKLLKLLDDFQNKHPHISLQLKQLDYHSVAESLVQKDIDILITRMRTGSQWADFKWVPLYKDKYQVILPRKHKLAEKPLIHLQKLTQENFVIMDRKICTGIFDDIVYLCSKVNYMPKIVAETQDIASLFILSELSMGVTIAPVCWKQYFFTKDRLAFIDIDDEEAYRTMGLCWYQGNTNAQLHTFLREMDYQSWMGDSQDDHESFPA